MNHYLTLDIGGTDLKYGVITEDEQIIFKDSTPTNGNLGVNHLISTIKNIFNSLNQTYNLKGIAISTSGAVDEETKILLPHLSIVGYQNTNLKNELLELNVPISVENDVNSMGLGEIGNISNRHNLKCVLAITLGTGIGGAIFINNELFRGFQFTAGEWGKAYTNQDLTSYENMASVSELVRKANKIYPDIKNGIDVYKYYDNNDDKIKVIVNDFYHQIAIGLANLVYTLNPEHIIIGGGITNRGPQFLEELKVALKKLLMPTLFDKLNLSLAVYGNDAGMIGAFKNFKNLYL